jgi:hypothetical protein
MKYSDYLKLVNETLDKLRPKKDTAVQQAKEAAKAHWKTAESVLKTIPAAKEFRKPIDMKNERLKDFYDEIKNGGTQLEPSLKQQLEAITFYFNTIQCPNSNFMTLLESM